MSNEQVWQKCIDTTLLITFSIVACHSGESPAGGTPAIMGIEEGKRDCATSYTEPFCGVASPGVGAPLTTSLFTCFFGRSWTGPGLVRRLELLESPFTDMSVVLVEVEYGLGWKKRRFVVEHERCEVGRMTNGLVYNS